MDLIDWDGLQKVADEAGIGVDLPDDDYEVKVVDTNVGKTQGGKPQIGVFLEVQGGPFAGKRFWDNLNLTTDSPKAVAMFILNAKRYGVPEHMFGGNTPLEDMAAEMIGTVGVAKLSHRDWNGKTYLQVKSFKRHNGSAINVPAQPGGPPVVSGTIPAPGVVPPPPVTSF